MVRLNFLNSGNQVEIKEFETNSKEKVALENLVPVVNSGRNSFVDKIKSILNILTTDYSSIKKLEENIIETFNFLKLNNLIPTSCPKKINFKFLRETYLEQWKHYQEQNKDKLSVNKFYDKYAESKLVDENLNNESIIILSTDYARKFVKLGDKLNGKFLKSLKNNFTGIPESQKIILEITLLHELGHLISAQLVRNTLISRSHRPNDKEFDKLELEINHVLNISRNILESFSDCFAIYLTQKHYPQCDLIKNYARSREMTTSSSSDSVSWYNVNGAIHKLDSIQEKDINFLIHEFMSISINNALNLAKEKIENDSKFAQELKIISDFYFKDLGVSLDLNKTLIENIGTELHKSCVGSMSNNVGQVSFNIQTIRNNALVQDDNKKTNRPS